MTSVVAKAAKHELNCPGGWPVQAKYVRCCDLDCHGVGKNNNGLGQERPIASTACYVANSWIKTIRVDLPHLARR